MYAGPAGNTLKEKKRNTAGLGMSDFDLKEFAKTAGRIRKRAMAEGRLIDNPSDDELRSLMEKEKGVKKTIYGNFVAESEPIVLKKGFSSIFPQPFPQFNIVSCHIRLYTRVRFLYWLVGPKFSS